MRFAFIDAKKAEYPIGFMCEQLGLSPSGYYAWKLRKPSRRESEDVLLGVEVAAAHQASGKRYGSTRVHKVLLAAGRKTSRKRVARLMRKQRLVARPQRMKKRRMCTTDSNHAFPIAPDLVGRDFTAQAPNKIWVTDITYIWTREGWLYLAAIVDLYSRRVVGWATSERIDTKLCLAALRQAVLERQPAPGLIHHSDRGSQYASEEYRQALATHGIVCSMSRKGDCLDNAVAESLWSTIKAELVELTDFPTRAVARQQIFEYIEVFYNRRRLHSSIDYRSPIIYESLFKHAAPAA
jgi:transposase InsO family protein